jgi:hypothetical protein
MDTSKSIFSWLHTEISQIRTRGFHRIVPDRRIDIKDVDSANFCISDYATFLQEFGWVQLYCDPTDGPLVSVYPVRTVRVHEFEGQLMAEFGFIKNNSAFFDLGSLQFAGVSPVFKLSKRKIVKSHESFNHWLLESCQYARSTFSKKRWEAIVKGPRDFSKAELEIVTARKKFSWKHVGFDEKGDAVFEVTNQSSLRLPYLSIGVQGRDGSQLIGGAWLDVSHIGPGESGFAIKDCYKEILKPDEIEFFDKLGPLPETMERYWEFKPFG